MAVSIYTTTKKKPLDPLADEQAKHGAFGATQGAPQKAPAPVLPPPVAPPPSGALAAAQGLQNRYQTAAGGIGAAPKQGATMQTQASTGLGEPPPKKPAPKETLGGVDLGGGPANANMAAGIDAVGRAPQDPTLQSLTQRYGSVAAQQSVQGAAANVAGMKGQAEAAGAQTKAQSLATQTGLPTPSQASQQSAAYGARPLTDSTQPMAGPTGFVSFQQRYGANAGAAKNQADILAQRVQRQAEVAKDKLAHDSLSGGAGGDAASQGTYDEFGKLQDQAGAIGGVSGPDANNVDQGIEGALQQANGTMATGDDALYTQAAGGATLRGLSDRYKNAGADVATAEKANAQAKDDATLAGQAEADRQAEAARFAREGSRVNAADDANRNAVREGKIAEFMSRGYSRAEAEAEADKSLGNTANTGMAAAEG